MDNEIIMYRRLKNHCSIIKRTNTIRSENKINPSYLKMSISKRTTVTLTRRYEVIMSLTNKEKIQTQIVNQLKVSQSTVSSWQGTKEKII